MLISLERAAFVVVDLLLVTIIAGIGGARASSLLGFLVFFELIKVCLHFSILQRLGRQLGWQQLMQQPGFHSGMRGLDRRLVLKALPSFDFLAQQ